MTKTALVLASLLALTTAAAAAERLPTLSQGTPYASVRNILLATGWRPVTLPDADRCSARDTRCKDRPEMLSCAGTGMANCLFTWQRNNTVIGVSTIGEEASFDGLQCRSGCR
ncbi:MAG: hypothetical protein J0H01_08160 [Rhizobiales bacterium]|nr:hypothetical protein [Hyphomicrobiales bacterium]